MNLAVMEELKKMLRKTNIKKIKNQLKIKLIQQPNLKLKKSFPRPELNKQRNQLKFPLNLLKACLNLTVYTQKMISTLLKRHYSSKRNNLLLRKQMLLKK